MLLHLRMLLGLAIPFASAATVPTSIASCLTNANVPFDASGSSAFTADALPFNARLPYQPAAIAVPTTIAQIQSAVSCAVKAGIHCTAKSGGHSYASLGLGGEDGHLVIELDRMYNVTLNQATNIAIIQPGARLGHVATQLYQQGKRAFSHGTCPGVGVSGHSLHGGYGMSSQKYGLAADWIVGMTVVLANASLVHTSATEHPDLFWALRGAGSNFGVVAQYEFATFPAPDNVTYFNIQFRSDATNAVTLLATLQDYVNNTMPSGLTMRMFASSSSSYLEGMYFGGSNDLKTVLNPFVSKTGLTVSTTSTTWLGAFSHYANAATDPTVPYSFQQTFYAKSLLLRGLSGTSAKNFASYWYSSAAKSRFGWWFQLDLYGGSNSAVTHGDHSTSSYAHRDKLFLVQFYDQVFSGSYPATGFAFLNNFVSNITAPLASSDYGMYINYADSNLTRSTAETQYYGASLPRLKSLKLQYDPTQLFYSPQSIEPAAGS